jgi:hypothetical protein
VVIPAEVRDYPSYAKKPFGTTLKKPKPAGSGKVKRLTSQPTALTERHGLWRMAHMQKVFIYATNATTHYASDLTIFSLALIKTTWMIWMPKDEE